MRSWLGPPREMRPPPTPTGCSIWRLTDADSLQQRELVKYYSLCLYFDSKGLLLVSKLLNSIVIWNAFFKSIHHILLEMLIHIPENFLSLVRGNFSTWWMASIEKLQLTSPMIEEFPSSSGTRRGFLFSHYCSELLSDVLANAAWEWEEIKGIPIWKVEVKLACLLTTRPSTQKILRRLRKNH